MEPKKTSKKMGRPSVYSPEKAAALCARIAEGESLRSICKSEDMPGMVTVFSWLGDPRYEDFRKQYESARQVGLESWADEILDIADEPVGSTTTGATDSGAVQKQRLRVDSRKWLLSKLVPKKYGERTTITGDADNPLHTETTIKANELFTSILQNMELKKQQASNE
jgi:hypothetical protein